MEPGLGIRDERDSRDLRDPPENPRLEPGSGPKSEILGSVTGTGTRNSRIWDPGPRFVGRWIPGLNYSGLSRGIKKSGNLSRGLKIFRHTVPVPCRPLYGTVRVGTNYQRNHDIKDRPIQLWRKCQYFLSQLLLWLVNFQIEVINLSGQSDEFQMFYFQNYTLKSSKFVFA